MKEYDQELPSSGNAFEIPDLWAPSRLLTNSSTDTSLLFSEIKLNDYKHLSFLLEKTQSQQLYFGTSQLQCIATSVPLLDQRQPEISSESSNTLKKSEIIDGDIWLLSERCKSKVSKLRSWEALNNAHYDETIPPYITEAGAVIFDTTIGASEDYFGVANDDSLLINAHTFTTSLLALGLGRNSVLFLWDEKRQTFQQRIPKLRISGLTSDTLLELTAIFMEAGNTIKSLQKYIDKCYSEETSPIRIALAHSVSTLLEILQFQLGNCASKETSILHLKTIFKPAHTLLRCFQQLVNNTTVNRSDESLLSTIFEDIQVLEHRNDSLRDILLQILVKVSHPWLRFAKGRVSLD